MRSLAIALALLLAAVPASAATLRYVTTLSGAAEVPVVVTLGTGTATVEIDGNMMTVSATFSDLEGPTTVAHIHRAPAGVNGPVMTQTPSFAGFPVGVTFGSFLQIFDLDSAATYRPGFITDFGDVAGAKAALLEALAGGTAYFNLHSEFAPGGELRGQLALVPLPAPALLLLAGLGGLAALRRRRTA